jgi:intracellular septation protein
MSWLTKSCLTKSCLTKSCLTKSCLTKSWLTNPIARDKYRLKMEPSAKPKLNPLLKLALDLGPLVLFFLANYRYGIFAATATFMVAVLAALAVSFAMTRKLPVMPVVTAVIVLVFGGLALFLHNAMFIKIKPTIIYTLFGGVLLGGLFGNKPLLGVVFDSLFQLTEEGWRKLTVRWAIFFFALAILNEIVWRSTSTNLWVDFKVFGVTPLTFLFAVLQVPLLKKYAAEPAPAPAPVKE